MFSWKASRHADASDAQTIGLAIELDRLVMVASAGETAGRPRIKAWATARCPSPAVLRVGLQGFVEAQELAGQSCRCTLSQDDYSLRLVERPPKVPEDELVDATCWLVRDLIEFDVESAQISVLTIPEGSSRARPPTFSSSPHATIRSSSMSNDRSTTTRANTARQPHPG